MNSDEELRELFTPAKRKAVALFKDNHDNGDTAIYQFITDIIPLLTDRDAKRDADEVRKVLDRLTQHGYLMGGHGKEYVPIDRDVIEAELAALKEVKK